MPQRPCYSMVIYCRHEEMRVVEGKQEPSSALSLPFCEGLCTTRHLLLILGAGTVHRKDDHVQNKEVSR